MSPANPHLTAENPSELFRIYQKPSDGRKTEMSDLPSPSKSVRGGWRNDSAKMQGAVKMKSKSNNNFFILFTFKEFIVSKRVVFETDKFNRLANQDTVGGLAHESFLLLQHPFSKYHFSFLLDIQPKLKHPSNRLLQLLRVAAIPPNYLLI